jgi:hypothetical protein
MPVEAARASVRAAMEPGRGTMRIACAAVPADSTAGEMTRGSIMSATSIVSTCGSMPAACEVAAARSVAASPGMSATVGLRQRRRRSRQYCR